jgi:hypothetical protein
VKVLSCPKCDRLHRGWRTYTACVFRPVEWVTGRGPWASVSDCPRGRTVQLYETKDEADKARAFIDRHSCGGACCRRHRVVYLPEEGGDQ